MLFAVLAVTTSLTSVADTLVHPSGPNRTPVPATCDADPSTGRLAASVCRLEASRADSPSAISVDGRLDEAIWASAQAATGFSQREPTPGAPATQSSDARIVYTDEAIYIGMRLFDTNPDSVRNQFVRRDDSEAASDWASVVFDSYYDRRTAFEFATNPSGARVDILHLDDTEKDVTWDAVWEVATSIDAEGWTAEFRIPLSQLRFSPGEELTWGVNFSRTVARYSEVSHWAPLPPTAGREVSLYGDLVGLRDLSPPGGVELLPYTLGRLTRAPGAEANPFYRANDTWQSAGVDLKYGLTSSLTLTATVNPDFGQVEADPSQVNLTAFETFYPEKRPFFKEGTEIFNFRLLPEGYAFYSRRIGRAPQLRPDIPADGFAETPETARIWAAVKLSGKTSNGWSVGLMNAMTGQVDADVSGAGGVESQPLEPRTYYTAGRLRKDFREGRSGLGILATAANRSLDEEEFDRLRSSSYTGGVDWWHRFGSGSDFEFSGWLLGTHARGSETAMAATQRSAAHFFTRSDADHLTYDPTITSMNGWAGEGRLEKSGGGNWTGDLSMGARSPGVELNDLGFLSYGDTWYGSMTARFSDFTAGEVFRSWYAEGQYVQAFSFGRERLRHSAHLRLQGLFLNFWQAKLDTDRWFLHRWPWELRGGPALTRSGYFNSRWTLRSDSRRSWTINLRGRVRWDDQGGASILGFDPTVDFRPSSRATVSLGPILERTRDADQWVGRTTTDGESAYVVGKVEQTTAAVEVRLSYGFTPTLNLDLYMQPFLSSGTYVDFRTVADAGEADFQARLPLILESQLSYDPDVRRYMTSGGSFRDPDFNVREFRMNAVLRWEYLPGSTLFIVWNQARADRSVLGGFDTGRDLNRLFGAPATNVLMVKVNYWLGL